MRRSWFLLISSLVLIAIGIGWIVGAQIDAQREAFTPAGDRASAIAAAEATSSPSPSPSSASVSASATPAETEPVGVPVPRRLRIPALDVNTKVLPVGLDQHQNMEIPEDIRLVGWYDLGVAPGAEQGSAVLVAHRDGRVQGRGVFYSIGNLKPGNRIEVTRDDKSTVMYEVVSRELISKKGFTKQAPELFAIDGPHRLTLISCGGVYDRDNGGYQANVIVTAMPVTA